jgi:hypothetical protein
VQLAMRHVAGHAARTLALIAWPVQYNESCAHESGAPLLVLMPVLFASVQATLGGAKGDTPKGGGGDDIQCAMCRALP